MPKKPAPKLAAPRNNAAVYGPIAPMPESGKSGKSGKSRHPHANLGQYLHPKKG